MRTPPVRPTQPYRSATATPLRDSIAGRRNDVSRGSPNIARGSWQSAARLTREGRAAAQDRGGASVGVLVERRYHAQGQPAGLMRALGAAGHDVRLLDPESLAVELSHAGWLAGLDAVVARGRSAELLTLLGVAELHGVRTYNRRDAIAAVRDKAGMAAALAAAGIPTPRSHLGTPGDLARVLPPDAFPAIVKPVFGDNGSGLVLVPDARALAELVWEEPVALVQAYVDGDDVDLKLYGVGRHVVGVRKASPFQLALSGRPAEAPAPVPLDARLEALGRDCAALFGLDLWGVDCVLTPHGPQVIEVNEYPNYTSVPGADTRLAALVIGAMEPAR